MGSQPLKISVNANLPGMVKLQYRSLSFTTRSGFYMKKLMCLKYYLLVYFTSLKPKCLRSDPSL